MNKQEAEAMLEDIRENYEGEQRDLFSLACRLMPDKADLSSILATLCMTVDAYTNSKEERHNMITMMIAGLAASDMLAHDIAFVVKDGAVETMEHPMIMSTSGTKH